LLGKVPELFHDATLELKSSFHQHPAFVFTFDGSEKKDWEVVAKGPDKSATLTNCKIKKIEVGYHGRK
jgi:hypothetical protein